MQMIWQDCKRCGTPFAQPYDPGPRRQFCSNACRQSAYRARPRYAKRAREQHEREEQARRWQEEARRAEEEARRRSQQRSRHQPPPHAGTSRPGSWCGACGGMRAAHNFHHDDARPRARPPPLRGPTPQGRFDHVPRGGRHLLRQGPAAPRQVRPLDVVSLLLAVRVGCGKRPQRPDEREPRP
jgi:hypothetical protein